MGRQRRTHGAHVYCTSSPGDRQHREVPTNATPHGIDFAALNEYDKRYEWVFCDHKGHGVDGNRKVPDLIRSVKKFWPSKGL